MTFPLFFLVSYIELLLVFLKFFIMKVWMPVFFIQGCLHYWERNCSSSQGIRARRERMVVKAPLRWVTSLTVMVIPTIQIMKKGKWILCMEMDYCGYNIFLKLFGQIMKKTKTMIWMEIDLKFLILLFDFVLMCSFWFIISQCCIIFIKGCFL